MMRLVKRLKGLVAPAVIIPVTVLLIVPLMLVALTRLLVPAAPVRKASRRMATAIAGSWLRIVVVAFRRVLDTRYEVIGDLEFDTDQSYIMICNHQSWVDVPVILHVFDRRLPFYRFFLKKELICLPLLGLAFWALEFPFIESRGGRNSGKHPERRSQGLESVRRASEAIQGRPVTMVNFPEGALFTPERHRRRRSPFRNLLPPKAGGAALVVNAIGDRLESLIDVTIHYPDGVPRFGQFVTNGVASVRVDVRRIAIPESLRRGDYECDSDYRKRFRKWINGIWKQKDQRLQCMRES